MARSGFSFRVSILLCVLALAALSLAQSPPKPKSPKDDVDELVRELLPKAMERLEERAEFYPFGATMRTDGRINVIAGHEGPDNPRSHDLLDRLLNITLQSKVLEENTRATAAVFDARITPPGQSKKANAIAFYLDHRDNYSVSVYFPYELSPKRQIVLGKAWSTWAQRRVYFPPPRPAR